MIASEFGISLAVVGDTNGDGLSEIISGAPFSRMARQFQFTTEGIGENYCLSVSNSTGLAARISAVGTTSIAANNLQLIAVNLPAGQSGIFFYSAGTLQQPFGNGYLCVSGSGSGISRLPVSQASAAGVLYWAVDYSVAPSTQISAASTWYFQAWYRDPAAGGAFFNTSDGLELAFVN